MSGDKTIFVLGAGASASANLPTQYGLLKLVFSISKASFHKMDSFTDFLEEEISYREQRIQEFYALFDEYRQELGEFIVANFSSSAKYIEYKTLIILAQETKEVSADDIEKKDKLLYKAYEIVSSINVSLEDLFTIFDSVHSGREHFRLYSPRRMEEIHSHLQMCIIYALSFAIVTNCNCTDYNKFAQKLIEECSNRKGASFSIITMNWDDVFERGLYRFCAENNENNTKKVYMDCCFNDYNLSEEKKTVLRESYKTSNKYIKVLKMHGSLAWLKCPRCNRIFTDYADEIASEEFDNINCPYCKGAEIISGDQPILSSVIITPTFMKSLNDLNLKSIWHNAYIELSEAKKIVFIGYSFPDADFEMRCLLKKSMRNDVKISVVLCSYDDPNTVKNDLMKTGCSEENTEKYISRMHLPEERYTSFFGKERVTFYYGGFTEYLKNVEKEGF